MPNPITFHCPHCNQAYQVPPSQAAEYANQTITCTACKKPFVVPPEIAAPQPSPQPAPTYQPPPQYPSPYTQPVNYASPTYTPKSSNGMAIASLVCGCFLCVPLLPGLLATIFGFIGLKATKDDRVGGKGLAIAGLCLGGLNLLGWIAYFGIIFIFMGAITGTALRNARGAANRVKCASNMKQIGMGILLYENDNKGAPPPDLSYLLANDLSPQTLVCPDSNDTPITISPNSTPQQIAASLNAGRHCSYIYLGAKLTQRDPQNAVTLYEPTSDHTSGANFLFKDGQVKWIPTPTAQTAISELKAAQNPPPSLSGF